MADNFTARAARRLVDRKRTQLAALPVLGDLAPFRYWLSLLREASNPVEADDLLESSLIAESADLLESELIAKEDAQARARRVLSDGDAE